MKVALVHEWLTTFAGSEQVLLALSKIYPEAPIYVPVYNSKRVPQFNKKKIHTSFLQKMPGALKIPQIYLPLMLAAFQQFDFTQYDVVVSSSHAFAKGIKTPKNTIHICYCHYPLRYVWEPSVDPRLSRNPIFRILRNLLKKPDLIAAARPDFYIANSKNTAEKIQKHYHRDAQVIYPPVEIDKFRSVKSPSKDYFLLAGRLVDYKNPGLVVRVFNKNCQKLKVVGSGPEEKKLKKIAHKNIEFLGRVPDNTLKNLYANCKALIFPGEEDFGIIPIEVMASGRPVLALKRGGAVESIIAGVTGDFFDEPIEAALEKALKKFDYDAYNVNTIREHALKFEKKNFQNEIQRVILKYYNNK